MKLEQLLKGVNVLNDISSMKDINIDNISVNAEKEMKNGLFFCYQGEHNGFDLIVEAIKNGAIIVVAEKYVDCECNLVVVDDVRYSIGIIAQNFFDSSNVKVIGITGTNGKTTTSFIIKSIMEKAGKKVGVIGTNGIFFGDKFLPAKLTTPDPIDLHEIFSIMKKGKVDYIVMEVSAHAIALEKIAGINFVCKILTNVTQDHLDYFKTMKAYQETKLKFFNKEDLMVVNSDDECGKILLQKYENAISYGINNPSDAFCIEINKDCNKFIMNISDNVFNVTTKLFGKFNVYNCLAGAVCCYYLGISIDDIQAGLMNAKAVEGRFNVINFGDKKIIIDFAHTPDGLENVLKTSRLLTDGKLLCLFGCGGNRDKLKRPIMGAISEKYADYTFVTSDNPRFEKPLDIINDILAGFNKKNYYTFEDRTTAIKIAINSLKSGDTLLICGKGAENYMDIKGKKFPYSDFDVVYDTIKEIKL